MLGSIITAGGLVDALCQAAGEATAEEDAREEAGQTVQEPRR